MKFNTPRVLNKRASYDYFIDDTITCGVILSTELLKNIRAGHASLAGSYARITNGKLMMSCTIITPQDIELLVTKRQLVDLKKYTDKPGCTLVPIELHFIEGLVKVELGYCKGKKQYDKREALKKKDALREINS